MPAVCPALCCKSEELIEPPIPVTYCCQETTPKFNGLEQQRFILLVYQLGPTLLVGALSSLHVSAGCWFLSTWHLGLPQSVGTGCQEQVSQEAEVEAAGVLRPGTASLPPYS